MTGGSLEAGPTTMSACRPATSLSSERARTVYSATALGDFSRSKVNWVSPGDRVASVPTLSG
ncbi:hypothetical protein E0504_21660 [Parafrankia sp. BMG5.11]|nr:hypothetical protein E0504_21660 [Parafrankia sp. BMG5.11]